MVITSQTKSVAMVILIWVTVSTLEAQVYPKADMASPNMISGCVSKADMASPNMTVALSRNIMNLNGA